MLALYAEAGFAGIKAASVAWCAAFKGAMLRRAGYQGSGSLAARSYLDYGEVIEPNNAKRGDIAIFKRGTAGGRATWPTSQGSTTPPYGSSAATSPSRGPMAP
ncbi:MAG: hypothetical protein IPK28_20525 [Devosia sp.]|nr:hypothetical protein [Devosia sp.]